MIESKEWVWLQNEVTRISHAIYKDNNLENVYVDDVISEVMQYFIENPDKVKRTIENRDKGNTSVFVFTVIKQIIYQMKWKQNYNHPSDYNFYIKVVNIARQYNITLSSENAYKLFMLYNALNQDKIKSIGYLQKMIEADNCYKYGCESVKELKKSLSDMT
jgi:hypothetical protein